MVITWVNAAALIGLGLIALPIAIHLLVRHHARKMPYPSLRFLRQTALAAFRRRRIEDAILLVCRAAIIAVAALAIAGPIVQTPSRLASHAGRTARALVAVGSSDVETGSSLASGAFRFASFSRVEIADAIRDAMRWLADQPPASREIVFSGRLTRGSIDPADLLVIPKDIGVRFVPAEHRAPTDGTVRTLSGRGGGLALIVRRVHFDADSTRVVDSAVTTAPAALVRVIASPNDQPHADAALQAVLEQGIRWTTPERRVVVVWDGANPPAPEADLEVIRMAVPVPVSTAADALRQALEASTPLGLDEPVSIPHAQLAAWSRNPGPPSPTAPLADEGDRRWLWLLALLLVAVEQWLRRAAERKSISQTEARVA